MKAPIRIAIIFISAFLIILGITIIFSCLVNPPSEIEVVIQFPLSIYAEYKDGRMVVRGTDTDAWIVGLPLGAAFILTGLFMLWSSSKRGLL